MSLYKDNAGKVVVATAWDGKTDGTSTLEGNFHVVESPDLGTCAKVATSDGKAALMVKDDYLLENQDGSLDVCKASHFDAGYTAVA